MRVNKISRHGVQAHACVHAGVTNDIRIQKKHVCMKINISDDG